MCGPSSGWSKAALVVLIVGMVLHIAGWATNNWMIYNTTNNVQTTNVGLWRMLACNNGDCIDSPVESNFESDMFNAVRGLETVTFCIVVFTVILLFIFMCMETARRQTFAAVIMFLCYIAGASSFIGMIIFVTSIPDPFVVSFSLGLTVIAMTLILIAGTLMIPDSFESDYNTENEEDDYEDDFFGRRKRSTVSPMPLRDRERPSRGATPISYKGGIEGSRWRSY
ncbi:unnamed protein product [Candidula unifasciata]|uniref:Uncharacterized protein n=1 Tax=Candidula unifasciata TaxID=100452 RepID=A0A8S3YPI6_9EUPU|nr:unnamed protein product [Candidula unifasciata]